MIGDLNGDLVSHIADFADKNDIRVLTQYGPESRRKGETDFRMDFDLCDAIDTILHRIFQGTRVRSLSSVSAP